MRQTRIIYGDNGTLSDWTTSLNVYAQGSETFTFVAAEDFIYIGQIAPFNHFYVKLSTPSTASTTMSIQYYSGSSWENAVEVLDETDGFKQSGFVSFVPSRSQGWVRQDTSGGGTITALSSVEIYDKYWARIKFSADLDASTVLSWIGNKFSDDNDLAAEYPDLVRSNVLTAFKSGKTDWEEQHVKAADLIISELVRKKIIYAKGQILNKETFLLPSVPKVAEIIFNSFGDDYGDNRKSARNEYEKRINKSIYDVDLNEDGRLDVGEVDFRQGFMRR
jgi:hypothetical protein